MTRNDVMREMMIALVNYRSEHYAEDTFLAGMQAALARAEECGWVLMEKPKPEGAAYTDELGVWHYDAGGKP